MLPSGNQNMAVDNPPFSSMISNDFPYIDADLNGISQPRAAFHVC